MAERGNDCNTFPVLGDSELIPALAPAVPDDRYGYQRFPSGPTTSDPVGEPGPAGYCTDDPVASFAGAAWLMVGTTRPRAPSAT